MASGNLNGRTLACSNRTFMELKSHDGVRLGRCLPPF